MTPFYAKVLSTNETSYDTNTLSVLTEDTLRDTTTIQKPTTLRIDESIRLNNGDIYLFETVMVTHNDKEQPLVKDYTHINDCGLSLNDQEELMRIFYDFAPIEIDKVKTSIETYLLRIKNPTIKSITDDIYDRFTKPFYLYPAATKFHHAYIGGLAHHTETMLRLADGVLDVYDFLDQDLLIAGIILHDVMKTVELSNYKDPEYTKEGKLIGHITMGVKEITKTAMEYDLYDTEERLLLEHIILSHHYYGNFGSPKKPNIPEALALHFIDNIDSKFAVLGEALKDINEGEFTPSLPVLDRERYYKAKMKK